MKKLIPLIAALALTFGAVTTFASAPSKTKATTAKSTKPAKAKSTKK